MANPVINAVSANMIADFVEDAYMRHHSSFVAIIRIPSADTDFNKGKHQVAPSANATIDMMRQRYTTRNRLKELPNLSNETIDIKGTTLAHVMSITKGVMGLLWAYYVYNKDGNHKDLRDWLLGKGNTATELRDTMGYYISPQHVQIHKIRSAKVIKGLTQTTGVVLKDTDGFDMFKTLIMMSNHNKTADNTLTTFDAMLREGLMSEVPTLENEFHYSDKMTQVTAIALEDMEKRRRNNFKFLIRDEILDIFFPPSLRQAHNLRDWPTIPAGYQHKQKTITAKSSKSPYKVEDINVENTLGFWGIRMTGEQMVEFGSYLLTHHADLLNRMYDDADFYVDLPSERNKGIQDEAKKLGGMHATRANWRYSYFWWIPRYPEHKEDNDKYRWMGAIGHQGQFILLELSQRWVFVRQHFVYNAEFQNVDIKHVSSDASDHIRYARFCYDAFMLVKAINDINNKNTIGVV
jgi:hypothetical protein